MKQLLLMKIKKNQKKLQSAVASSMKKYTKHITQNMNEYAKKSPREMIKKNVLWNQKEDWNK